MKETLLSILNRPLYVTIASLAVAGGIATAVLLMGNPPAVQAEFVQAVPGTISLTGQATSGSSTNLTLAFAAGGQISSVEVAAGDSVKKGDVLAALDPQNTAGGLTQARAAYAAATAAYQKVVNGATGPTIDAARAAVTTAKVARDQAERQQDTLVENARRKLYSDNLVAVSDDKDRRDIAPTITGAYNGKEPGEYEFYFKGFNDLYNNKKISFIGLEKGDARRSDVPQPFGTRGLLVAFPDLDYRLDDRWTVEIPNTSGANYASNLNAYEAALQTRSQTIATADAAVAQAESNLNVVAAAARPEDVAAAAAQVESARGALQIAQAAYDQRRIIAPGDGTITAVRISAGQVSVPNAPAIEMSGASFAKDVTVVVPNAAIINVSGRTYVRVKSGTGIAEKDVTIGIRDNIHTEILSGISVGEEVELQPY